MCLDLHSVYPIEYVALVKAAVIALNIIKTIMFGENAAATCAIACKPVSINKLFFLP